VKESVNAAQALAMLLEDPDRLNGLGLNAAKSLIDFAMKDVRETSRSSRSSRSNVGETEQCQFLAISRLEKKR